MDELEQVLRQNYEVLRDPTCAEQVRAYVARTSSMEGECSRTIKMLTKVAHHVLDRDAAAFDTHSLERLVRFCAEGLRATYAEDEGFNPVEQKKAAHLVSHGSEFAYALFQRTGNARWAIAAYDLKVESAIMLMDVAPDEATVTHAHISTMAKAIAARLQNPMWMRRSYAHTRIYADWIREESPERATHTYAAAAHRAAELYAETGELRWVAHWEQCVTAEMDIAYDIASAWNVQGTIERTARQVFERDSRIGEQAYHALIAHATRIAMQNPNRAAYWHVALGSTAAAFFRVTGEPHWAEEGMRQYSQSLSCYERRPDPEFRTHIDSVRRSLQALGRVRVSPRNSIRSGKR